MNHPLTLLGAAVFAVLLAPIWLVAWPIMVVAGWIPENLNEETSDHASQNH